MEIRPFDSPKKDPKKVATHAPLALNNLRPKTVKNRALKGLIVQKCVIVNMKTDYFQAKKERKVFKSLEKYLL